MTTEATLDGKCLCGGISVKLVSQACEIVLCHCSQCRKSSGAPFLSVFPVPESAVELFDPQQLLASFRATEKKERTFCRRCGSPIYSRRDGQAVLRMRAGLFEYLPDSRLTGHIFMAAAANWYADSDELPRYPGLEPGRQHSVNHD